MAPRHRRDRLDRDVVLLRRARQPPRPAEGAAGRGRRRRRRVVGDPRRRLLPDLEVDGGAARAAGAAALVQVGGVHDVALRVRPARRPLLPRRGDIPHRPVRPGHLRGCGDHVEPARARRRVGALRRRLPRASHRGADGRLHARAGRGLGLRREPGLLRTGGVPPGRRDARHDHGGERPLQHHPGALGADPGQGARREAGSRAGARCQAPVGAQQLPDAAGRLHDDLEPLPVHVRPRPCVARAGRARRDRRVGAALLQSAPCRAERLVDPAHGRGGGRGAGSCDRAGRGRRRAGRLRR